MVRISRVIDPATVAGRAVKPVLSRELNSTIRASHCTPVHGAHRCPGRLLRHRGYVIVLTDVTEDKVSMEELLESERTGSITGWCGA